MAEKRKFIRFGTFLKAFQLHDVFGASAEKINCDLKNVSRGGLSVSTENILPIGSSVKLEIKIPGNTKSIMAAGEVVWSEKKDDSHYDFGMRFTKVKNEDKANLLDHAYEEWITTNEKAAS